jgi:DNA-binding protein H-NS
MAAKPNIDDLSFSELEELNQQTQDRMKAMRELDLLKLLEEVTQLVKDRNFSLEEVFGVKTLKKVGKRVSKQKYKNPENGSQTWSGVGRTPNWLKKLEDEGRNRGEFLISTNEKK